MPDDYVKRSDVHKAFQPKYAPAINRTFAAMIDSVPAAEVVEVRHGRWIPKNSDGSWRVDTCSVCGKDTHYVRYAPAYDYCPNCGAKLDGGQDDV